MYHLELSEIQTFGTYLQRQERAPVTVQKYLRYLEQFCLWLPDEKNNKLCNSNRPQRLSNSVPCSQWRKYRFSCFKWVLSVSGLARLPDENPAHTAIRMT